MIIPEEKKQIIREAIHIIHDICANHFPDPCDCSTCPFWSNKEGACIFDEVPDSWPLSKKTPTDWNYADECKEDKNE